MAYSKVIITFLRVPEINEYLNIQETSRAKFFIAYFQPIRNQAFYVKIPQNTENGYVGFTSTNFKDSFEIDANMYNEYLVEDIPGAPGTGLGKVIITAKYTGAIFSVALNEIDAWITYETGDLPSHNDVTPNEVFFKSEKHSNDISFKQVNIVTTNQWEITSIIPTWLEISQLSGIGNSTIQLRPINYSLLPSGLHQHFLSIKIEDQEFTVAIKFELFEIIENPYELNKPAFTLDKKNFVLKSDNLDSFFQFDINVTIYKFFSNESETLIIPQKILLFKGKQEINIGLLIHRLLDRFNTINNFNKQYKLANVDIECIEKKIQDESILNVTNIDNIKFVAGLSRGFNNYGFLEFNSKPSRVTTEGYYFLNILIPQGFYEIKVYKNNDLVDTKTLPIDTEGPICEKVFFANFNKGDYIEYKLNPVNGNVLNPPTKAFYIFPSQLYSNIIIWENEFLLQSTFEFTNDFDIKAEIERQSGKTDNRFVENTTHYSVSKENTLSINTGWISKNDIDSVESLLLSKRAFIKIDSNYINLVPITKSIKNFDSNQELYDFTIEFIINRTYNEETYTF